VVVGVKAQLDHLVCCRGIEPGIGGRIRDVPSTVGHFPFRAPGIRNGDICRENAVAAQQVTICTVIIQGVTIGGPDIKITSRAPGAGAAGSRFDEHPAGVAVEQEDHLLVSYCGGEADVSRVDRASVRAKSVPGAGCDHFADVTACARDGVNQAVIALAHISHERGGVGVIPALEVTDCRETGRECIAVDIDNVTCGQQCHSRVGAVVIGVKHESHQLVGGAGNKPGIGGRMHIAPIAAFHRLPFVGGRRGNCERE